MPEKRWWVCPVCGGLFDSREFEPGNPVVHCLDCDHHYPLDGKRCHNCQSRATRTVACVPTALTLGQVTELINWSRRNGYRRGVEVLELPGGRRYVGGLPD